MSQAVVIDLSVREQRTYDRMRSVLIAHRAGETSGIRDLLLLLPDLVVLLFRLLRDPRVPLASKAIAGGAVAYILSPIELLPELILGPVGLIDDLVVVGAALSRMLNYVHPDVVRFHWSGQGDALEGIQRVSAWTEDQLTRRARGVWSWLRGARAA